MAKHQNVWEATLLAFLLRMALAQTGQKWLTNWAASVQGPHSVSCR
jgi:hypothetical protein